MCAPLLQSFSHLLATGLLLAPAPLARGTQDPAALGATASAAGAPAPIVHASLVLARASVERVAEVPTLRCKVGPRAILLGPAGERLGVVREHRFEADSGRLRELVTDVAPAGEPARLVRIPFEALVHDLRRNDLVLEGGAAALSSFSEVDPPWNPAGAKSGPGTGDDAEPRTLTCGELLAARVMGSDAPFGSVEDLLLDPREGRVAFVVVRPRSEPGQRADPKVIPWSALVWNTVRLEGSVTVGRWRSALTRDGLRAAPGVPGGDLSLLSDPAFRSRVRSYHAHGGPSRL